MQEGGNVENTEQTGFLAPSLTSEVLPDETVDTSPSYESPRTVPSVNTDEGFYASNPAPGETMDEFTRRTTRYELFNENQIESQWHKPLPIFEQTSYTPPEDYVSPRISTSFADVFGYGGEGSGAGDFTNPNNFPTTPDDSQDTTKQDAIIEAFGTFSDAMVAWEAAKDVYNKDYSSWRSEMISYFEAGVPVDEALTLIRHKDYYPDWMDLEEKRTQYALDKAYGYVDADGNVSENYTITNEDGRVTTNKNTWDSVESWFTDLGKTTLFTSEDQTFNVTVGNIADDAFAALITQFFTGDTEKALIAGAGSFAATNVTDMAIN